MKRWLAALLGLYATAQAAASPQDWPCVQRFVPVISAATVWPYPQMLLSSENEMAALSEEFTAAAVILAKQGKAALPQVEKLIAPLPANTRGVKLSALYVAVVAQLNRERDWQLRAILNFAKKQRNFAKKITADQNAVAAGKDDVVRLEWNMRLYDEREKRLKFLCERPVLLEKRAFLIGRALANQVE